MRDYVFLKSTMIMQWAKLGSASKTWTVEAPANSSLSQNKLYYIFSLYQPFLTFMIFTAYS